MGISLGKSIQKLSKSIHLYYILALKDCQIVVSVQMDGYITQGLDKKIGFAKVELMLKERAETREQGLGAFPAMLTRTPVSRVLYKTGRIIKRASSPTPKQKAFQNNGRPFNIIEKVS